MIIPKPLILKLLVSITIGVNTQDCDCPEWNGTVIQELAVDPCNYTQQGDLK